jgi:flagellar basal-body rod modification protein FlgD
MVEKLEDVSKHQQEMITAQLMTTATSMLGRTVTYTGPDGKEATGVVASTTIGSNPTLRVGNTDVALSSVKEVRPTTSSSTPPSA